MTITARMHKAKETTRFVAYDPDPDEEPVFGTTYVRREVATQLGSPETIVVTIEAA
jgi:hypothetical protein